MFDILAELYVYDLGSYHSFNKEYVLVFNVDCLVYKITLDCKSINTSFVTINKMLIILNRICFIVFLFWMFSCNYFVKFTRFRIFMEKVSTTLKRALSYNASFWVIYILFFVMFFSNLTGNIPLRSIPTLFYSQTFTLSLMFWVPIIVCVFIRQFKFFIAHILPYGSPVALIIFLPIVEIFSQLIRPFTLMIRLRTNLSRGHIMLYMFSYFTLLSDVLSFVIVPAITVLFVLEVCISMLQAYIFVTLVSLYLAETV